MWWKKTDKVQSTKEVGQDAEGKAIRYLQKQGLSLVARNFRASGRGAADLDAVMRERDGTIVFVEVRLRGSHEFGGAAASISAAKKQRLIKAAQFFLMRYTQLPSCRFDVVGFEPTHTAQPLWYKGAFEVMDNS